MQMTAVCLSVQGVDDTAPMQNSVYFVFFDKNLFFVEAFSVEVQLLVYFTVSYINETGPQTWTNRYNLNILLKLN